MERKALDSCGSSLTGETPQEAQAPRRLTAGPAESKSLERKSTAKFNRAIFLRNSPKLAINSI
ncbi:hypothetical protein DYI25_20300 [Mesobacillus boroniphilus]|uniref:Uncharacterized protein n=1 Tax=Mesobacillus boroniphilus TaxID=308892 RepID=A0A944GZE6_9BACI|nr:hypothetical protein [Mesobacillus boroniphilus]